MIDMQSIYEETKTSFKYGIVIRGQEGAMVDCPNVFRHGSAWHRSTSA